MSSSSEFNLKKEKCLSCQYYSGCHGVRGGFKIEYDSNGVCEKKEKSTTATSWCSKWTRDSRIAQVINSKERKEAEQKARQEEERHNSELRRENERREAEMRSERRRIEAERIALEDERKKLQYERWYASLSPAEQEAEDRRVEEEKRRKEREAEEHRIQFEREQKEREAQRLIEEANSKKKKKKQAITIISIITAFIAGIVIKSTVKSVYKKRTYERESVLVYEYSDVFDGYVVSAGKQYTCPSKFIVPLEYNNKPVKAIKEGGFQNQTSLKELIIQDNIVEIGNKAFKGCNYLTNITVPFVGLSSSDGTKFSYLFDGFANSVPSSLNKITCTSTIIKEYAFQYLSSVTTFDVSNATEIKWGAFSGCTNASTFLFSSNLKSIESHAFTDTKISSFNITSKLENIGSAAFTCCYYLRTLNVESNNNYYTFESGTLYNKNKTELVLHLCSDTQTSFAVPSTVTKIENQAFYGNKHIINLILNEGLVEIGDYAFQEMPELTTCTIPSTVNKVGGRLFCHIINKCNIQNVNYNGTKTDFDKIEKGFNAFDGVKVVYMQQ